MIHFYFSNNYSLNQNLPYNLIENYSLKLNDTYENDEEIKYSMRFKNRN